SLSLHPPSSSFFPYTTLFRSGLLPLMIHHFHRFSAVSPVANVVEAALISLLMITGAAYLMIHSIIGAWALKLAPVVNAIGWLTRSEEHTSELQSLTNIVCRLL